MKKGADYENGVLVCRSCESDFKSPARYIGNAYAMRHEEGSSWDWPLCRMHLDMAMVAGWFPFREVGEESPFDPVAYLHGVPSEEWHARQKAAAHAIEAAGGDAKLAPSRSDESAVPQGCAPNTTGDNL